MQFVQLLLSAVLLLPAWASQHGNPNNSIRRTNFKQVDSAWKTKEFWLSDAKATLQEKLLNLQNRRPAKNVILFLGDGMSVPTVTAARIYDGQLKGLIGERNKLSFENFPYVGLSKTYSVNHQVADSASTATAYLGGVKTLCETIGITAGTDNCTASNVPANQVDSIAEWALNANKSAGIVTTTRITHASPAGTYAHTISRNFESDRDVLQAGQDPNVCKDIAAQLIEGKTSKRFSVILGGGKKKFLPLGAGERRDGRNLINEWKTARGDNARVVFDKDQLRNVDIENTDYLLGLFSKSHLAYHLENRKNEPLLEEMTETAIKILQKNDNGYFLFVEGGRIDHGHHDTQAVRALDETTQFANAIERAVQMTDPENTLIVVTADHGHTITISGYSQINNSITGLNTDTGSDGLPYFTLSYANGPGFDNFIDTTTGERKYFSKNLTNNQPEQDFRYPPTVPLDSETHGGADVAVYANGPWAHLFSGVYEQNVIPILMGFVGCMGPGPHSCDYL